MMNLLSRLVILSVFLILFVGCASAATYYVAQTATGDGTGSSISNNMSVSSHNGDTFSPGDTIYLVGTITSKPVVPNSGTAGNWITYRGDYAGHPGVLNFNGNPMFSFNDIDYLIIDGLTLLNGINGINSAGGNDNILIKNCDVSEMWEGGIGIGASSQNTNITVGGAEGDGNDVYNVGRGTGGKDVGFEKIDNLTISWNNLYADAAHATGASTDRGIDGIVLFDVDGGIIEYNNIHGHQDNYYGSDANPAYNGRGEDGMDLKNNNINLIIRNNNIYNNRVQGIQIQLNTRHVSIYENNISYNALGVNVYPGAAADVRCDDGVSTENISIYRNRIHNNTQFGVKTTESTCDGASAPDPVNNVKVFQNVLAYNGLSSTSSYTGITLDGSGTGHESMNNIYYINRPNEVDYRQIYNTRSDTVVNNNSYYWPSQTSIIYWLSGDDTATDVGSGGIEGDPLFVDIDTWDFNLTGPSPVIDAGTWITNITSSTNTGQTSFTIEESIYFYDGNWKTGEIGNVIKTEGGEETTITDVNYNTNTITVSPAIDIIQNEGLSLDYNGTLPDIGVYEYSAVTSYDNALKSNAPNTVTNDVEYNGVGKIGAVNLYRSWIQFDLSGYNLTDIITSANLSLHWYYIDNNRNQTTTAGIYYPNTTVDSDYLTWNNSSNGVPWDTPGGTWLDAAGVTNGSTPFDSILFPDTAADNANHTFNITELVQSMVNGSRNNNGFFVIADETNTNYISFSSLDNATEEHWPTLDITHSIPPAPTIISWENDDTSDNTLDITVDTNQNVLFNATADYSIDTWLWTRNSTDQSNNYDNLTLSWVAPGTKNVTVTATNAFGTSSEILWNITVEDTTDWADSNYSYRKYIVFNEGDIYGTNTNFSALISITDSDIANNSQSDGGDIAFFIGSTQMPHDLEKYNSTTGHIRAWARMDELSKTNNLLHLYYGYAGASNQWNASETWQDYSLVMHFDGDPTVNVLDSSNSGNNGTASGTMTSADEVTGKIGNALDFDGDDYVEITGLLSSPSTVTLTSWVNLTSADTSGSEVISLGDCVAARLDNPSNTMSFYHYATGWHNIETTDNQEGDGWTYMAASFQPNDQKIIKNAGVQLAAETNVDAINYAGQGANTQIGRHGNGQTAMDFTGQIDEIRVTTLIRDTDWIHTEYGNQNDPTTFYIEGTQEAYGTPDTKFEYFEGTWKEGLSNFYLYFACWWYNQQCPNAEQSDSQPSLKVTNNGTGAGIPKLRTNESAPSGIRIFVDDDNNIAGAVELNDTYQAVSTSLAAGENVTLWSWANLSGAPAWEFETEAVVE